MIYHCIYFFETEQEARSCSYYFSAEHVTGTAHILHGDGVTVPFHVHVLVDVKRKEPFSKDILNVPGYQPYSILVVKDLFQTFFYLLRDDARTRLMCYGSLAKKYKDYLRDMRF